MSAREDSGVMDLFADIPTGRLRAPTPEEVPGVVLANTLGVQSLAKRLARREEFETKLLWTVGGGSVGVIVAVFSAALYIGGELAHLEDLREAVAENRARVTHLEQKMMARERTEER
jgi:hypothetical protein